MLENLIPLYSARTVKQLDSFALEDNITGYQLMCRAGQAAFSTLEAFWPEAKKIAIVCGYGNNGGDGLVLARLCKAQKKDVQVFQVGKIDELRLTPEAREARQDWRQYGEIEEFKNQKIEADVIVDAILGTGIQLPLRPEFEQAINVVNASGVPILALDLPSGLDASTGYAQTCIQAQVTITFIGRKLGLNTHLGLEKSGIVKFDNLGVSGQIYKRVEAQAYSFEYEDVKALLPKRQSTAHKGSNGHVLVIGGGQLGFSGAACLAAESALRSGAGLVSVGCAPESTALMSRGPQEMMCHGVENAHDLNHLLERATLLVLGPGLTQSKWAKIMYNAATSANKPMVIDADGLNLLAQKPFTNSNWILTPHPGEAARLLGVETEEIQKDRISSAIKLVEKYQGIVVLKGAGTIVASKDNIYVCPQGVPSLATGGTGDVLAGMIGGLWAQHLEPLHSALIAVATEMQAGLMERELGSRGMIASDLFLHIRTLLNPYQE